jgi:hypothetical protein
MGPGDHPFTRFGHNAILLEWGDSGTGRTRVYNYGTFAFNGLGGVSDFMTGRFRYWLSVSSLPTTLRAYGRAERALTAQELELSEPERAQLFMALERNLEPSHRYYDYDYYRDNCSTRVRDVLDELLQGALKNQVRGPGRLSFRQHTLRLVGEDPLLYFGLDVALGRPTDRPITRWEELFLPQELHDELRAARREVDGRSVPLVRREQTLLAASRPPALREPQARTAQYALVGVALGALLLSLGRLASTARAARVAFSGLGIGLGTLLGLLGLALAIFSLSKHSAAHYNPSLLAVPPWGLVVAWYSAWCLRRGAASDRRLVVWLACSTGTSSLLLVLGLFFLGSDTLRMAALFAPIWLGWLLGARASRSAPRGAR